MQRGFRHALASFVPVWLSNRPALNNGYKFLYAIALVLDCFVEAVRQGLRAWFPFLDGRTDTLPMIGRSRGLVQGQLVSGLTQSNSAFADMLRAWLDIYFAGTTAYPSDAAIAQRLHVFLGTNPVRLVDRSGNWVTLDTAGTISRFGCAHQGTQVAFPWDTTSNPERNNPSTPDWADLWIVVYAPPWAQETRTLATIAATFGTFGAWAAPGLGIGHAVPRTDHDQILALIDDWRGAHVNVRAIIWDYTTFGAGGDHFDPAQPSSLPDGKCGPWGWWDGTNDLPHRPTTAVYWEPYFAIAN